MKFLTSTDHHYRARFIREARAVSKLNHPNIAMVHDYGETEQDQPFIVMEFGMFCKAVKVLRHFNLEFQRIIPRRLITTATVKQMRQFIETECGICCKARTDSRRSTSDCQPTSLFRRLFCRSWLSVTFLAI